MYPMILSVSSGDPRGRGLNVIFITEYQEATTPLNKLERKKKCFKTTEIMSQKLDISKEKKNTKVGIKNIFTCTLLLYYDEWF